MRRRSLVLAATLILSGSGTAVADEPPPGPYVALGDSYTAAPLVPSQVGTPIGCARSDHDYPSLVAQALRVATFVDVSCSAATTQDMTAPQSVPLGTNPPQLDGLRAGTRLVTVGIGGNDIGLVEAAVTCATIGLTMPTGAACRSYYTRSGRDEMVSNILRTAPKIGAVLRGIRARAPLARVVLVGYPDVLPRTGSGCWPAVPLSADDVRYFDGLIVRTNAMLATQATANDVEFADTYRDSVGHDVCTLPGTRWFEGLVPTALAFPLHPNGLGMASMARSVLRVVAAPRSRSKRRIAAVVRQRSSWRAAR